jgi:hypothetical protein
MKRRQSRRRSLFHTAFRRANPTAALHGRSIMPKGQVPWASDDQRLAGGLPALVACWISSRRRRSRPKLAGRRACLPRSAAGRLQPPERRCVHRQFTWLWAIEHYSTCTVYCSASATHACLFVSCVGVCLAERPPVKNEGF